MGAVWVTPRAKGVVFSPGRVALYDTTPVAVTATVADAPEHFTAIVEHDVEPRRLLQQEPELPRVDRVGAAARRPPFPAQRGPRVNADFSSTRAALGMARVRHKTRSPVAIQQSKGL